MFNLLHLQQERAHKTLGARELVDKAEKDPQGPRPMTAEEVGLFDKLQEDIKNLDAQIAAVQEHEQRREASAKLIETLEQPAGRRTAPDAPANAAGTQGVQNALTPIRIPAAARRTGVLKAFKGEGADQRAYRAGMWARAALFNDARAQHWCLNNGLGVDIRGAMSTGSNTDGGFLVPEEMSQAIIDLREQYGVFRQNVRVWPMGSDTLLVPRRLGGITIGPVGENPTAGITQSNPTFNQVELVAKKAGGLTLLSSEIAEDAVIDLADWIAQEFAYAFGLYEDQCGFTGDGTSTYLRILGLTNILTTASGLAGAVAAASGHDTFAEIDQSDIAKVMAALPQYATMGARWYMSRPAYSLIFARLQAVAGGNTVQTLQGQTGEQYLGYPVVISQVLPTSTGTINGTPLLFFGDLRMSSAMGDRRMVKVFPSEHRYMDTDQIGIRGTERFDIVNHSVGDSTTPGPIVALCGTT